MQIQSSLSTQTTDKVSIRENEYFDQVDNAQVSRVVILRNRIKHYCKLIEAVYKNITGDLAQIKKRPQGKALTNNTMLTLREESEAIAHIRYLRQRVAYYQNEISYLTGEGLCD